MQPNSLIIAIAFICTFSILAPNLEAQQAAPNGPPTSAVVLLSRDIKPTLVDAPNIPGNFGDKPQNEVLSGKKWLMVAFEFKAEEPIKGYIEELTFKISIEAKDPHDLNDKVGVPVILTAQTTFVNVPARPGGTKNTAYFFVPPAVVERFGGSERGFRFQGDRKSSFNSNIRIQALMGGQPIPLDLDGRLTYVDLLEDDSKWVDQCKPIANQVLGINNSPWAGQWTDSTPMVKPPADSNSGN